MRTRKFKRIFKDDDFYRKMEGNKAMIAIALLKV